MPFDGDVRTPFGGSLLTDFNLDSFEPESSAGGLVTFDIESVGLEATGRNVKFVG